MFLDSMSTSGSYRRADTGIANVPAGDWLATLGEKTVTAGMLVAASCAARGAEDQAISAEARMAGGGTGFMAKHR
jgi:hypothetical protein